MEIRVSKALVGVSAFVLAATVWCRPAAATSFNIFGAQDSDLTALVDFEYDAGVVSIEITNNSPIFPGEPLGFGTGWLTAFAFNVPSGVMGIASFSGPTGWDSLFDKNGIDTPGEFGLFDAAASTRPFFGGDWKIGIPPSATFNFAFTMAGNLTGLTTASFLNELSADEPPFFPAPAFQTNPQFFIARFDSGGVFEGEGIDIAIIPELATMFLVGIGLGLTGLRKKLA